MIWNETTFLLVTSELHFCSGNAAHKNAQTDASLLKWKNGQLLNSMFHHSWQSIPGEYTSILTLGAKSETKTTYIQEISGRVKVEQSTSNSKNTKGGRQRVNREM